MKDEIVEEVRRVREEYAAEFEHDVRRIAEDLRRREQASGREYVTMPPRLPNAKAPSTNTTSAA